MISWVEIYTGFGFRVKPFILLPNGFIPLTFHYFEDIAGTVIRVIVSEFSWKLNMNIRHEPSAGEDPIAS